MKKIAILQPNYIPWKGVFDLISRVDVFVFYDDVQYTVKDWRNRNKLKTANGELWLTVPVKTKGLREQRICDAEIDTTVDWQSKHYKSILSAYRKAPFFQMYEPLLHKIYLEKKWTHISELDIFATKLIAHALNIQVEWYRSSDLNVSGSKDGEKVVKICKNLNCDYFINGPASKAFMNEQLFNENSIELSYMTYDYPEYPQLYPPFNHFLTVLDVLFNCGEKASNYIFS